MPFAITTCFCLYLQPNSNPFPVPIISFLPFLGILDKWNHRICDLLCLAFFTQHNIFASNIYQQVIPFNCQTVFHWVCIGMHLVYPLCGHLGCFYFGTIMNQADMNICCRSLCGICFQLSWENTYNGIARTYGKFMFNIKKKKLANCFPKWSHHFAIPPGVYKGFTFSTSSPTLVITRLSDCSHSSKCRVAWHWAFCSLMTVS